MPQCEACKIERIHTICIVLNMRSALNLFLFYRIPARVLQHIVIAATLTSFVPSIAAQTPATEGMAPETITDEQQETPMAAAPIIQERVTPNTDKIHKQLLANEVSAGTIQWITADEEFLAIWEKERSGAPYGAILIIHGEGQTPDWPQTIRPLRQSLPDYGWSTLSISLPNRPVEAPPSRENAKSAKPEPSHDTPDKTDDIVFARLKSAIAFLHSRGQFNIVLLAQAEGANRAARYLTNLSPDKAPAPLNAEGATAPQEPMEKPIRALIMVNARNGELNSPSNLTQHLKDPTLPILDVYFGDHILDESEPQLRKKAAKKQRLKAYHQVKLLIPSANWQQGENRLTRRVRGFLNKYAKGVEIEG